MVKKKVFFSCSETQSGGESIATQHFLKYIQRQQTLKVIQNWYSPQATSDTISFFTWIIQSFFFFLKKSLQQPKIDYFYTTTYTAGLAGIVYKKVFGCKLVFHYHGSRIPEKPGFQHRGLTKITQFIKYQLVLNLHKAIFRSCDLTLVPSPQSKLDLQDIAKPPLIKVVENGVNLEQFHTISVAESQLLRQKYSLSLKAKVLVFIGRMNKEKNIEKVIEVYKQIYIANKNTLLLLAYPKKNQYFFQLKDLALSIGLQKNIIFLENTPPPEIYWLADLVISFSKKETLSMVMLEALTCGRLFFSTHQSTKIILESISPLLYGKETQSVNALANSVEQLFDLPSRQKQALTKNAVHLMQNYSWQKKSDLLMKEILTLE